MKQIIRLTESELHKIIKESVNRYINEYEMANSDLDADDVINEDGEGGGAGATNCAGVNVGGAIGQAKNTADYPFGVPLKQKHNLGSPTTRKANGVDMGPAFDRTPGFSVNGKK